MEGRKTLCDIINIFMNRVCKKQQRLKKSEKMKMCIFRSIASNKTKTINIKRLNKKLFDKNTN